MLTYKTFKEKVVQEILSYMPQKYTNMQLITTSINHVNRVKDGIYFISGNDMFCVSPMIYINDMYKDYKRNQNFSFVMKDYAEKLDVSFNRIPQSTLKQLFNKEKIVFQLINTSQNKELLKNVPYRTWNDLSIIYQIIIDIYDNQVISQIINNKMAKHMNMKEDEFFKAAFINSKKIFPFMVKNINEVLVDVILQNSVFKDFIYKSGYGKEWFIWIVSNEKGYYGATSILYEEELHLLAEQLNSDLFILPCSIHEIIIIPAISVGNISKELTDIISHINKSLDIEERLSNSIYYYDKNRRETNIARTVFRKELKENNI